MSIDDTHNLANDYYYSGDYVNAVKYYNMAIDAGSAPSMNNLGYYYNFIEGDHDKANYYYTMAISHGFIGSARNLGNYYKEVAGDFEKALYYYVKYYTEYKKDGDIYDWIVEYFRNEIDMMSYRACSEKILFPDDVVDKYRIIEMVVQI
jgi:tetratricopeptide (TPR) repeat protein